MFYYFVWFAFLLNVSAAVLNAYFVLQGSWFNAPFLLLSAVCAVFMWNIIERENQYR